MNFQHLAAESVLQYVPAGECEKVLWRTLESFPLNIQNPFMNHFIIIKRWFHVALKYRKVVELYNKGFPFLKELIYVEPLCCKARSFLHPKNPDLSCTQRLLSKIIGLINNLYGFLLKLGFF